MNSPHSHQWLSSNLIYVIGVWIFLSACASGEENLGSAPGPPQLQTGSCMLDLPVTVTDEDAIAAVLKAEGSYVVQQDISLLMRLWHSDGLVADANHTPTDSTDDQTWQGSDAIRHRYVRWVFPGAPGVIQPSNLVITIVNGAATVTSTTRIDDEVSPGGDLWQLTRVDGCWVIQSLTFNLEKP